MKQALGDLLRTLSGVLLIFSVIVLTASLLASRLLEVVEENIVLKVAISRALDTTNTARAKEVISANLI
jgi:hypothetical protein